MSIIREDYGDGTTWLVSSDALAAYGFGQDDDLKKRNYILIPADSVMDVNVDDLRNRLASLSSKADLCDLHDNMHQITMGNSVMDQVYKHEGDFWDHTKSLCEKYKGIDDVLGFLQEMQDIEDKHNKNQRAEVSGIVYLISATDTSRYKIGVSVNPKKRRSDLQKQSPFELEIIHQIETEDSYGLEEQFHERFAEKRVNGEWFELAADDISWIKGQ